MLEVPARGFSTPFAPLPLAALATGMALVVLWLLRRFEKSPDEMEPPPPEG